MRTPILVLLALLGLSSLVRAQNFSLTYLDAVPPGKNYLLGTLSLANHAVSMDENEYFSGQSNWPFEDVLHFSISTKVIVRASFTPGQNLWGLNVTLYTDGFETVVAEGGVGNRGQVTKSSAFFNLTLPDGSYKFVVSGMMTTDYQATLTGSPNDIPWVNGYPAPYEIYFGGIGVSAILPPNLSISQRGSSVIIFWPNTGNYTLQQNTNLTHPAGWTTSGYDITTSNGTNSITVTQPVGNLFFRLSGF